MTSVVDIARAIGDGAPPEEVARLRRCAWWSRKHPTWPDLLIRDLADTVDEQAGGRLPALYEFRFVPCNWTSPKPYHKVLIILRHLYPAVHDEVRLAFEPLTQPVAWGADVMGEPYVARVDYHPTERPFLVCIGGIR